VPKRLPQPPGTGETPLSETVARALRAAAAATGAPSDAPPPRDPSRYGEQSAPTAPDARTRAQQDAAAELARREFLAALKGKSPAEVAAAYAARFVPPHVEPPPPLPRSAPKPVDDLALDRFEQLYGVNRHTERTARAVEREAAKECAAAEKKKRRDDPRRKFYRDRHKRARARTSQDTSKYQLAPWLDVEKEQAREKERAAFEERWRNRYGDQPIPVHRLDKDSYFAVQQIVDDHLGNMAAFALQQLSRASNVYAVRTYWAAVGQLPDGTPRLDLTCLRARCVIAAAFTIWCSSGPHQRSGFCRKVRAMSLHYIARAMGHRTSAQMHYCDMCECHHVHPNTLTGRHDVTGTWQNGRVGYLEALHQTQALQKFKPTNPQHLKRLAEIGEVGPSGWSYNQYDLATDPPELERVSEALRQFGDQAAIARQLAAQQVPRVRSKFQPRAKPEPQQQPP
jgi:hypothetical protein